MRVASGARDERPVWRSIIRGAWKPSTALRVTQMRLLGMVLSTSVQAERHGPSMTTRSPVARTSSNRSRNSPICPPGLPLMRTSAAADPTAASAISIAAAILHTIGVPVLKLPIDPKG